jgi:hypothetical protein
MNHLKRIGIALLILSLIPGITQAAEKKAASKQSNQQAAPEGKPDATVRLNGGSFALGVGFSWGGGTLIYKGKEYPISVNGLSLGKVGISGASAAGEVYGLKHLGDFDGHYNAFSAGLTVAGGRTAVTLRNQNGVRVNITSTTRGLDVTVGGSGVTMKIKK